VVLEKDGEDQLDCLGKSEEVLQRVVTVMIGFILLVVRILYLIDWAVLYSSLLG